MPAFLFVIVVRWHTHEFSSSLSDALLFRLFTQSADMIYSQ